MFYRVTADFVFANSDEANDFYHDCQVAFPKTSIINPGQPNEEKSSCKFQLCYHDETPTKECEVIDELP